MLLRVALFKLKEDEYEFTWTHHHIVMDGWCTGVLVTEFNAIYSSILQNIPQKLPAVTPYKNYIRWLEKQDEQEFLDFWEKYLDGYTERVGLPRKKTAGQDGEGYNKDYVEFELAPDTSRNLESFAGKHRVTINTVFQVIWSLLLMKYTGKRDVVFGAVVSGRPSEIPGIEYMIGLFINTIPVRIRLHDDDMKFTNLLVQSQKNAIECEPYHYYSLAKVQSLTPLKNDLLDHVLVFENFPDAGDFEEYANNNSSKDDSQLMQLAGVESFEQADYDFGVQIAFENVLQVKLVLNTLIYDRDFVKKIPGHFREIVRQVMENNTIKLKDIEISYKLLTAETKVEKNDFEDFGF